MTTNIIRAAKVLYDEHVGSRETRNHLVRRLAADGLLAPDLPEPIINADDGNPEWHADEYTVDVDQGRVWVNMWTPDGIHWEQTPNQARTLADALYAAANHAEKDMSE